MFHSGGHEERRSSSNFYRGSQQNVPFVEFPPTLPRSDHEAPIPPPHRSRSTSNDVYRPITKSRSYADWDDRRGFGPAPRRHEKAYEFKPLKKKITVFFLVSTTGKKF